MTSARNLTRPSAHGTSAETVIDWRQDGACRSEDPSLFFAPDGVETPADRDDRVSAARRICAECDVFDLCNRYAMSTRQQHGIWAGRDSDERAREIKRLGWRKRHGSAS